MSIITTFEDKETGCRSKIYYDQDADSPRQFGNSWVIATNSSRQIDEALPQEIGGTPMDYARENFDAEIIVPVYLYEHSGSTYRAGDSNPFTCPWDSGLVGVAVISKKNLDEHFGGDKEKARQGLDGELEVYTDWVNGSVYGYSVESADGSVVDSCNGIYGFECVESEAQEAIKLL